MNYHLVDKFTIYVINDNTLKFNVYSKKYGSRGEKDMKKNTKGFTLIELLAVIVILAIIALIAVPVIMNIITKARKSAAADTAYSVLDSAELWYANHLLENPNEAMTEKTFSFAASGNGLTELDIQGTKPTEGVVTLSTNGTATITTELKINGFSCSHPSTDATTVACN